MGSSSVQIILDTVRIVKWDTVQVSTYPYTKEIVNAESALEDFASLRITCNRLMEPDKAGGLERVASVAGSSFASGLFTVSRSVWVSASTAVVALII